LFPLRNKKGNPTFDKVKEKLSALCSGAERCAYCEDSKGDEVEHIYPKDLYPSRCFEWDNYLYACGPCNGPKNNQFAIFRDADGVFQAVQPPKGQLAVEPPSGEAVLLNPRVEDPLNYCMLDLATTFKFVIIAPRGTKEYDRANYTFNTVLKLNDQREYLRKARKSAYGNYRARLLEYNHQKGQGATPEQLAVLQKGIRGEAHPTVWKEMQRYHSMGLLIHVDAALDALFVASPEALTW
jgi:hypothetical protein